jgi:hypothetical protein
MQMQVCMLARASRVFLVSFRMFLFFRMVRESVSLCVWEFFGECLRRWGRELICAVRSVMNGYVVCCKG